jgi:hypothetical protein
LPTILNGVSGIFKILPTVGVIICGGFKALNYPIWIKIVKSRKPLIKYQPAIDYSLVWLVVVISLLFLISVSIIITKANNAIIVLIICRDHHLSLSSIQLFGGELIAQVITFAFIG